mmetsp:Transcript_8732/g.18544  ORF Transcript_8732/g.18544 Transcript_8732/m.18544 type:complete len:93 (+) Transcript_8732:136-414(+)
MTLIMIWDPHSFLTLIHPPRATNSVANDTPGTSTMTDYMHNMSSSSFRISPRMRLCICIADMPIWRSISIVFRPIRCYVLEQVEFCVEWRPP